MAQRNQAADPISPLAEYLLNVLYDRWHSDRRDLETKWESNDCTIRKIRQENWKEGEGEDWRANNFVAAVKQKWLTGCALVLDHILEGGVLNAGLKVNEFGENLSQPELDQHTDDLDQATRHIHTQFELGKIDRQTIKAVLSAGKYGMAWALYYVDTVQKVEWRPVEYEFAVEDPEDQRFERIVHDIDVPMVEWVPVWEMFWDMTEDDIKKGDGFCREQNVTPYQLRQYAKTGEGWLDDMIEAVIKDSSSKDHQAQWDDANVAMGRRYLTYRKNSIKFREFRCRVPNHIVEEYLRDRNDSAPETDTGYDKIDETDGREQELLCVVANDRVVRFLPVDDDTDIRKAYRVYWEDDLDHDPGVGVADNGGQMQEVLNGAFNAFQDNKKLSGDIQGFYSPYHFSEDESMTIEPGKFRPTKDTVRDAREAVHQLTFTDTGESLISMIRLAQEFIDEETNIPKMAQGGIGAFTPKTAYEASQMMEKSGKYIASVIRNFDNDYTEPITRDFFEYNMMDPNNPTAKGNFTAIAKGFTSFQDKVIRVQKLMQLMSMVTGNEKLEGMVRMLKLMEEILRANDIDPDEVLYSEEEYLARQRDEHERMMQLQQQQNDPEKEELEKEKLAAQVSEIEREQDRKDDQFQLEKMEFAANQRDKNQQQEEENMIDE